MSELEKRGPGRPPLLEDRKEIREGRPDKREAITGREERIPLGISRLKMKVPEIPGFHLRWINDEPGRLVDARDGGYEFVLNDEIDGKFGDTDIDQTNRDLGVKVCRSVSKTTGLKAYLMKIRQEYFDADQKAKQIEIDETDRKIHNGKLKDFVSQYVPKDGIQIRTSDERI